MTDESPSAMVRNTSDPFLFLAGNKPWVCALADELAHDSSVHATAVCDWNVARNHTPTWPDPSPGAALSYTTRVLPTGYASILEPLIRPYMTHVVNGWQGRLTETDASQPWVVTTRPFTESWTRAVPNDRLIYYNLDDYELYRPDRADRIKKREDRLIERSRLTLCLSKHQVNALSHRHPTRASQIRHFPLGVTDDFINPHPRKPPELNTVGYIGNLSDRIDWNLVDHVVRRCPELRFIFVGSLKTDDTAEWVQQREDVLSYGHVEHVNYVPQPEVKAYYWSFAVNWIPYDTTHPFNLASCPTKIMDGIGSGRSVVSTSVPECTLYPRWITVADEPKQIADHLREMATNRQPRRNEAQVEFARTQTWSERASLLRRWIADLKKPAQHST